MEYIPSIRLLILSIPDPILSNPVAEAHAEGEGRSSLPGPSIVPARWLYRKENPVHSPGAIPAALCGHTRDKINFKDGPMPTQKPWAWHPARVALTHRLSADARRPPYGRAGWENASASRATPYAASATFAANKKNRGFGPRFYISKEFPSGSRRILPVRSRRSRRPRRGY